MIYNDEFNRKVIFNSKNLNYLDKGGCAKVFTINETDKILKKYFKSTPTDLRISKDIFNLIRLIDSRNLMKVFDIFTSCDFNIFKDTNSHKIIGYTAKYYKSDDINPLLLDKEYLIENFRNLEKLIDIFNDLNILAKDLKEENVVFTKDNIVIIDPDLFSKPDKNKDFIKKFNSCELFSLLINIIVKYSGNTKYFRNSLMDELIDRYSFNDNISDILYKKLKYVKKPIDYFKK